MTVERVFVRADVRAFGDGVDGDDVDEDVDEDDKPILSFSSRYPFS